MLLYKNKDPKTTVICLHNLNLDENQTQLCHNICNTTTMLDVILYLKNKFGQNKKIYLYTSRISLFNGDLNTYVWNILTEENLKKIYFSIEDNDQATSSTFNQPYFQSCISQENTDLIQQTSQYDQQRININQNIQQSSTYTQLNLESTNNNRGQIGQVNSYTMRQEDMLKRQAINAYENNSLNESNKYQINSEICQLQDGITNANQDNSVMYQDFCLLQKEIGSLSQKYNTLANENQKLKKQNEELYNTCEEQKREILNLRNEIEIKLKFEDQKIQNNLAQDQIINLKNEILSLREQGRQQQEKIKISINDIINKNKEIQDLTTQNNDKDIEIKRLKEQLQGSLNQIEFGQSKIEKQKLEYKYNVNSSQLNQTDNQLNKGQDQYGLNKYSGEDQIIKQQQEQFQEIQQKEQTVQQQKQKPIIKEVEQKDEYYIQCGHTISRSQLKSEMNYANILKTPPRCPLCCKIIDLEQLYKKSNTNAQLETIHQKSQDLKNISKV